MAAKETNFEKWTKGLTVEDASTIVYAAQCGFCPVKQDGYCEKRLSSRQECLRVFREWAKLRAKARL